MINRKQRIMFIAIRLGLSLAVLIVIFQFSGLFSFSDRDDVAANKTFNYDFVIKDLAGNPVDAKSWRNKVVFINLWATWCGPCRQEMASIQSLYESTDHDQVIFVMLSLDEKRNDQKVIRYIADKRFTFPVFRPGDELPEQLDVPAIPTTIVVGRDGKIKLKKTGAHEYDTDKFKKFIDDLTKE
jgi:thiol-disulfide isomerase/thioredoxin